MTNTSATGGYLTPTDPTIPNPGGGTYTLEQFLQSVIAGITGIVGSLVRPLWQEDPPPEPDIGVDWVAFGISDIESGNAYVVQNLGNGGSTMQEQETIQIDCTFTGPNANANAAHLRAGFQLAQNREQLFLNGMGFKSASKIQPVPDLINRRWFKRAKISIFVNREVDRVYQVLYYENALGEIITDNIPQIIVEWDAENAAP